MGGGWPSSGRCPLTLKGHYPQRGYWPRLLTSRRFLTSETRKVNVFWGEWTVEGSLTFDLKRSLSWQYVLWGEWTVEGSLTFDLKRLLSWQYVLWGEWTFWEVVELYGTVITGRVYWPFCSWCYPFLSVTSFWWKDGLSLMMHYHGHKIWWLTFLR